MNYPPGEKTAEREPVHRICGLGFVALLPLHYYQMRRRLDHPIDRQQHRGSVQTELGSTAGIGVNQRISPFTPRRISR